MMPLSRFCLVLAICFALLDPHPGSAQTTPPGTSATDPRMWPPHQDGAVQADAPAPMPTGSGTAASISPRPAIGVLDLQTACLVHPRMALFDFNRRAFYRLPVHLDPREWEKGLADLRAQATAAREAIAGELAANASAAEVLESQRVGLLAGPPQSSNASGHHPDRQLADLAKKLDELERSRRILEFRRDHPELTAPDETRAILHEIEGEVLQTSASLAAEMNLEVVLNRSTVLPPPVPPTGDPLAANPVPFLETDLYYSLLTRSPPASQAGPADSPNQAAAWLTGTRHPQVSGLLEFRPHPLVLHGGVDLTPETIRRLFRRNRCSLEAETSILSALASMGRFLSPPSDP